MCQIQLQGRCVVVAAVHPGGSCCELKLGLKLETREQSEGTARRVRGEGMARGVRVRHVE